MKCTHCLWSLVCLVLLGAVVFLIGQPADDGLICAAVHPCNLDGSVFPPYNEGDCSETYARQCALDLENRKMISERLNNCEFVQADLQQQLIAKTKQVAALKKLVRKLKN